MSTVPSNQQPIADGSGESLKQFQLATQGISDKSKPEWGKAISKFIWQSGNIGIGGYYYNRNNRFLKNRMYANGRLNIQAMFQDRFKFNGKENYINLNWQAIQINNRIISGLVGRWMARGERIQVNAIDTLSVKEKQEEYENIEFILYNRKQLEEMQQESGVQLIPQNQFIPADQEELNLWQAQFQRLPEEILYEMGCNDVLSANGWFTVLKEKMLHDSAEVGLVGTYTWMDEDGLIHVEWCKPEDMIYSYSDYEDFRDTTWRGKTPSIKISDLRKKFGKEFNPDNPNSLTEQQLWKVAQTAKAYQYYTNITQLTWSDGWLTAFSRPYDEWNVRIMYFEYKTVDSEPYTVTKTKATGATYTQKGLPTTASGNPRNKPSENQTVYEDKNWNIYEGVYLPDNDILLKWNLKQNMIRPNDPKEIGNAEFSYSFYMYQNFQMMNMAVPEKIEAAVDGMILALLKMQQVVARMRPTGAAVNIDALQNIDYGLGDANSQTIDYKKLYDQTGDIYYRGKDSDGNPIPVPIQELQNSGFLSQMDGLIRNYQFNYQILKDELGEDPNLITAALQPRVTGQNVEASQTVAEFATDYMYRAYAECMKDTARKVSCLLTDSVMYGAKAYRDIVGKEDIEKRQFTTDVQFLPTEIEIAKFEQMLNTSIASNQDLILYVDPFELVRVAKQDVKLATLLFRHGQKKMLISQQQQKQAIAQQTIEGQVQAAQSAELEKRKTKEMEVQGDVEKSKITAQAQNQSAVVNMVASLLKPGADGTMPQIPNELKPFVQAVLENVMVGAIASTDEQKQQIIQQMQSQAAGQQEEPEEMAEQEPQPQQQDINQQPEMAA